MISIKESKEFLWLLICADVLFIFFYLLHKYSGYFQYPGFSLVKDRSFAETFQYIKEFWAAIIFLRLFIVNRQLLYPILSVLFAYILIDDLFRLHESLGKPVAEFFGLVQVMDVGAEDFGQFTFIVFLGLFFSALISAAYLFGDNQIKKICRDMLSMLFLLFFFGAVFDIVHAAASFTSFNVLTGILEDGGEMVVMSVICWYAYNLLKEENNSSRSETVKSLHQTNK